MRFNIPLGTISLFLLACSQEVETDPCAQNLFSPNREIAYTLDQKSMVLRSVNTPDTTFFYLQWFDEDNQQKLFLPNPGSPLFSDKDPGTYFIVSGAIKASCSNEPTINGQLTEIIEVYEAIEVPYCEVEAADHSNDRKLQQTTWRFMGFRINDEIQPPTCEENFLSLVFSSAKVIPEIPDDPRFKAEILNGAMDCDFIYEFMEGEKVKIYSSICYSLDVSVTSNSKAYGEYFLQGLLDPGGLEFIHEGNSLILVSTTINEEMVFTGL